MKNKNKTQKSLWHNFKIGQCKLKNEVPRGISFGFLAITLILVTSFSILLSNCSVSLSTITSSPIISPAYASSTQAVAENVIVLIIDGIRNDEAFDDPTHQYIPHIWNDLRPQGTINTNFWNTGITATTAGHTQLLTGVRANLTNQTPYTSQMRSKYPNIFEYYRKQKNIPQEKTWFIAGKGRTTGSVNISLHPDYADLGASAESINRSDAETWASVQQKMETYHPSLMMINLRDVDHYAHETDYITYTNAIKTADQIVYDLWNKIQTDPYYQDKTDLIITTDHGRHSDGYFTGFKDHGRQNHGCRHLLFLALGPDFKQNTLLIRQRDQLDIVPTIGAILGVQTPYADGEVMTELFNDTTLGKDIITGGQRRLSLAADKNGLHAVWSEKNGQEWDIYYKRSQDGGVTWTDPIKLFSNGLNNNYFYEAKITSQDSGLVYVTATGYSLINEGGPTYSWKIFGRRSLNGGKTWEMLQELQDSYVFVAYPSITSYKSNIFIIYSSRKPSTLQALYSNNQGATFVDYVVSNNANEQTPLYSSVASDPYQIYVAWTSERNDTTYKRWNVFFDKSDYSLTWQTDKVITGNTTGKIKFFATNSLAANNSGSVRLLITKRQDTTDALGNTIAGKWNILLKTSFDYGESFAAGAKFYDSTLYEAWNPKISYLNPAKNDFMVLWEQYYNNSGAEIYGRKRVAGAWQSIIPISSLDSKDSAEPDLTIYNGNSYVGWQDYESGNWQIKVQKVN